MSDSDRVPRGAANARERMRMRVLSKAFGRLKLTLPWVPPDTKLSKLDTLRLATSYISHLKRMLSDEEDEDRRSDDAGSDLKRRDGGLTLSLRCWPYGPHHRTSVSSTLKSRILPAVEVASKGNKSSNGKSERLGTTHEVSNGRKLPSPKHYAYENVDGQGSQVETQSTAMHEEHYYSFTTEYGESEGEGHQSTVGNENMLQYHSH